MATVLFADVRGFTTFAERATAREAVAFLNAFFAAVVAGGDRARRLGAQAARGRAAGGLRRRRGTPTTRSPPARRCWRRSTARSASASTRAWC